MAGQRGFLYERSIFNKLRSKGITPTGSQPAGTNPNLPDATFIYKGEPYKLEVKLDLRADFGQGTLNYIDGILRQINSRTYHIKNALEHRRFEAGF